MKQFKQFKEFYPFYLEQHQNNVCMALHFIGTVFVLISFVFFLFTHSLFFLFFMPIIGYGFAWVGHFVFEKNKPATFQYPLYSLMGDFLLFKQIIIKLIQKKKS